MEEIGLGFLTSFIKPLPTHTIVGGMVMKDIFWKYFTETGNIEAYLEYKRNCRENETQKERKSNGVSSENKGSDSQDGQQR